MAKEYDFIIVGQGLAGTCLTRELHKFGQSVLVIDSSKLPSSSEVAGGLFNPITGRRMVLTWKASELFSFLREFYSELEELLEESFLHFLPLYRPFASNEELNEWQGRLSQEKYNEFIDQVYSDSQFSGLAHNPIGGVKLKESGYLNTSLLISRFREYLKENQCLINEEFVLEKLNYIGEKVVYKENRAKKIIFCCGPLGFENELVGKIRFHALKGEVLQLELDDKSEVILNRNAFILPRDGKHIAGSNYDLMGTDWEVTEKARLEIQEKIDKILISEYKIIGQKAGLRPTTHDRRPVAGLLPENPKIGIFNGLGTKGVSLAPFFANQLAGHLVNGSEMDSEVQIGRFYR